MNTKFRTIDIGHRRSAAPPRPSVGAATRRLATWAIVAMVRAFRTGVRGRLATMNEPPGPAAVQPAVPTTGATAGYACPMHSDRVRVTSGTCPICGLTLEPLSRAGGRSGPDVDA